MGRPTAAPKVGRPKVSDESIQALRDALTRSPDNAAMRLLLAEQLEREGLPGEALDHFGVLLDADELPRELLLPTARLALDQGRLGLTERLTHAARKEGLGAGLTDLEGSLEAARRGDDRLLVPLGLSDEESRPWTGLTAAETLRFSDVGGLDDIKAAVEKTIILPFHRPELYERYGRRVGGGILLYGPPGVGKTMLARAVAGECRLPFLNVRIEDILDPYFGVSEQNLHQAFVAARAAAPCVLFLDELDAIAFARRRHGSSPGRTLVDQLLQELDAIGADNRRMLVLAATNAPWDVDEALKRPGRFDRLLFVPPPDAIAREAILTLHLADRPARVDITQVAKATHLFSGADLAALVERATDRVIDEALETGGTPAVTTQHVEAALRNQRPSTLDWLERARNYVEFANDTGAYDDVAAFLRSARVNRRNR
jgi:transitional endoplasmic reticulum ATPase